MSRRLQLVGLNMSGAFFFHGRTYFPALLIEYSLTKTQRPVTSNDNNAGCSYFGTRMKMVFLVLATK